MRNFLDDLLFTAWGALAAIGLATLLAQPPRTALLYGLLWLLLGLVLRLLASGLRRLAWWLRPKVQGRPFRPARRRPRQALMTWRGRFRSELHRFEDWAAERWLEEQADPAVAELRGLLARTGAASHPVYLRTLERERHRRRKVRWAL